MIPEFWAFLPHYKKKYIINDLVSGLLVAIIALPLSIALGIQTVPESISSNGIQMGLITTIVAGFLISFLGGSRFQIGGPTPAFVVLIYTYLLNPSIGLYGVQFATILAGVILVIFALSRVGNLLKFVPYPILVGFSTGIGITLIIGQIKDLFGLSGTGISSVQKISGYIQHIYEFNWVTFLIGSIAIIIIFILNKVDKRIPGAFIALIICTGLFLIIKVTVGEMGVSTFGSKYGEIDPEFYPVNFSNWQDLQYFKLIVPSISIALVVTIESLLSATVADGLKGTKHNPNQELIAQGVANIGSGLLGGLPATGVIARTAANVGTGARSPLSGILHSIFILIMYFSLMDILEFIPLTIFSAILITVAIKMCNFPRFFKMLHFSKRDSAIVLATTFLTIFLDLIYGVFGGIFLSIISNSAYYRQRIRFVKEEQEDNYILKIIGNVHVFNIDRVATAALDKDFEDKKVTIDFTGVHSVDATACEKMLKIRKSFIENGRDFNIENISEDVLRRLEKFN